VGAAKAGSMFGKYQLTRLLGQDGMGEVYEAHDTSKDRTVALKILPEELSRDEGFRTRFQRESRAAAILEEPHVIPIHDWGQLAEFPTGAKVRGYAKAYRSFRRRMEVTEPTTEAPRTELFQD